MAPVMSFPSVRLGIGKAVLTTKVDKELEGTWRNLGRGCVLEDKKTKESRWESRIQLQLPQIKDIIQPGIPFDYVPNYTQNKSVN